MSEKTYNPTEYMKKYRAEGRDHSTKVQNRAKVKALAWVRSNHPEVWQQCMAEARVDYSVMQERANKVDTTLINFDSSL